MSQSDPIRVYTTHAWELSDDYLRVFEYLESAQNFYYRNCSNPEQRPVDTSTEGLRDELRRQMAPAEVVVALSSLHVSHRELMVFQVHFAKASNKPVLLLPGFGSELPMPRTLTDLIDGKSDWDKRGLVDAIRQQARHEETQRWDTIEFKID